MPTRLLRQCYLEGIGDAVGAENTGLDDVGVLKELEDGPEGGTCIMKQGQGLRKAFS